MIGLALVMLFMLLYYRLLGLVAVGGLVLYTVLVLAAFKLVGVTLTLSGLSAFVVSVGMAVDANVIIFERMREELRSGRTLGAAIEAGFDRAWSAIRDSQVTTFIVMLILWWFGDQLGEPRVIGFAITLMLAIIASVFTAFVVTRDHPPAPRRHAAGGEAQALRRHPRTPTDHSRAELTRRCATQH